MQIIEVDNAANARRFLEVNVELNKSNPNYIRPLDSEIEAVFDARKNKHAKQGKIIRWILEDKGHHTIGRIAAFTYSKYKNYGTDYPVGGIGFFDCIDDQDAANLLFDTAQKWLQAEGMDAMDGPINFGDRDKWWGLMVEGFDVEPYYGMSFNPPYYQKLFEDYGFRNYYNQYYFYMSVAQQLPERFQQRHERFSQKKEYSARHLEITHLEKYARDFTTVYNAAWAQHKENKTITASDVMRLFAQMKPIIDPQLVWFAYFKDEPIAMWINIPDINQYFKHFNGKFGVWQKIGLLYRKMTKKCHRFTGVAFGVVPKYQALGIDSFMIYAGAKVIQSGSQYKDYEMGWTSEWNPKMLNVYQSLGSRQSRRMVTYRYIFDGKHPFERHPEIQYTK
ncbi:MAG: hypothetical protein QM610_00375 [Chitinophagaceae bacterium]